MVAILNSNIQSIPLQKGYSQGALWYMVLLGCLIHTSQLVPMITNKKGIDIVATKLQFQQSKHGNHSELISYFRIRAHGGNGQHHVVSERQFREAEDQELDDLSVTKHTAMVSVQLTKRYPRHDTGSLVSCDLLTWDKEQ